MPNQQPITVSTQTSTPAKATWHYYTESEHVVNWNFASEDWHCPKAVNDLRVGGEFLVVMAAKNGEMTFDLEGTYDEVDEPKRIAYTLANGRKVRVDFTENDAGTQVKVAFDPEPNQDQNQQKEGWQNILKNFKNYVNTVKNA